MFISDNIIPFFGRKIKVINFHNKGQYLNKLANRRYRKNHKILQSGRLAEEFGEWLKDKNTYKFRFVLLGDFLNEDIQKIIDFTNTYYNISFYVYSTKNYLNITHKKPNLKVIYISKTFSKFYDNTVAHPSFTIPMDECPKYKSKRPCDTCLKCCFQQVRIPQKVLKFLFP